MSISRALMGVGASFATVPYMKGAAYYTTHKTVGIVSSLLGAATMLGVACSGTLISLFFQNFGWQKGLNMVAIIGFIMACMVPIFQKAETSKQLGSYINFSSLKEVIVKKITGYYFYIPG